MIRDLVIDMTQFYTQWEKVKPFLINDEKLPPVREHLTFCIPMDRAISRYAPVSSMCQTPASSSAVCIGCRWCAYRRHWPT